LIETQIALPSFGVNWLAQLCASALAGKHGASTESQHCRLQRPVSGEVDDV